MAPETPDQTADVTTDLAASGGGLPQAPEIVTPASARALFWRPRYTEGSGALRHLPFLYWLTDLARPARVAQIGLGDGVGYFALCQALERTGAGARASAVADGTVPDALERYNEDHYAEFSTLRPGDARSLAGRMADGSVDLLVLGRVPGEADVAALSDEWPGKLSARGVIVILGAADWPVDGAARLWLDKMGLAHPTITFEEGAGLVALLTGPDQPGRLADLARLGDAAGEAHHVFRRLGAAVHHEWAARDQATRADAAQARAEEAEERVAAQEAELTALKDKLVARETEAARLAARLEGAEAFRDAAGMTDVLRQHGAAQTELGRLRAELTLAETRADENRRAREAAREAAEAAEAARAEAERIAAERVAAKDRALQQIGAELAETRADATRAVAEAEAKLREDDDLLVLTRQLERGREDRDAVNRALQELKVAHKELNAANRALSADLDRLRAERDGAWATAEALTNSTFWKMTAPARRAVDGLRRLRHGRPEA